MLTKQCLFCGKKIDRKDCKDNWHFKQRKFCSRECYWESLIGKPSKKKGIKTGIVPKTAFKKGVTGSRCANWKGGKFYQNKGYILKYCFNHPNNNYRRDTGSQYPYQLEHRLVVEKILNRYLTKQERVHHINEIRDDNRPENLYLFPTDPAHISYHLLVKNNKIKPITKSNLP